MQRYSSLPFLSLVLKLHPFYSQSGCCCCPTSRQFSFLRMILSDSAHLILLYTFFLFFSWFSCHDVALFFSLLLSCDLFPLIHWQALSFHLFFTHRLCPEPEPDKETSDISISLLKRERLQENKRLSVCRDRTVYGRKSTKNHIKSCIQDVTLTKNHVIVFILIILCLSCQDDDFLRNW